MIEHPQAIVDSINNVFDYYDHSGRCYSHCHISNVLVIQVDPANTVFTLPFLQAISQATGLTVDATVGTIILVDETAVRQAKTEEPLPPQHTVKYDNQMYVNEGLQHTFVLPGGSNDT